MRPVVSLVLPSYNEAHAIAHTVRELDRELSRRFDTIEIIVVDDGSSDGTSSEVHTFQASGHVFYLRHRRRLGKGSALRTGMLAAKGGVVAYTDADLPIDAEQVTEAIQVVLSGRCDVCVGNRFHRSSRRTGSGPLSRRLLSRVYRASADLLGLGSLVKDPMCCLKVFSGALARHIATRATIGGFLFDAEALALAREVGATIEELAVDWTDKRARRPLSRLAMDAREAVSDSYRIHRLVRRSALAMVNKNGD